MSTGTEGGDGGHVSSDSEGNIGGGILIVAPRGCRFSPEGATSIDLHIAEIARQSRYRDRIAVAAPAIAHPFEGIRHIPWDPRLRGQARDRTLAAIVEAAAPALVVVHQHLGTAAGLAQRLPGRPVALVRHNYVKPPGHSWRAKASAWLQARRLRRLAGLGFVSPALLEAFRATFGSHFRIDERGAGIAGGPAQALPLFLSPNGIDTRLWRPEAKRDRLLFTGRLAPEKGVLEAAEACTRLLAERPGWEAVFVLDSHGAVPAYARAVRAALAPAGARAAIHENLAHEEVRAIVATSAVALVPTLTPEPFGRVALEAMAAGAAVVASAAGGLGPLVAGAGITLERADAQTLAAAVLPLMDDPAARARLAEAGRMRAAAWDLAAAGAAFDRAVVRLVPALAAPDA